VLATAALPLFGHRPPRDRSNEPKLEQYVCDGKRRGIRDELFNIRDVSRAEEDTYWKYGRRWMRVHYLVGTSATILAGASALVGGLGSKQLAVVLAGVASLLTGLITWFKPGARWDFGKRNEREHQALAEDVNGTIRVDLIDAEITTLKKVLEEYQARRRKLVQTGSAPS
jgi:hypothetical protein